MKTLATFISHAASAALLITAVAAQGGTPPPFEAWVNPQTGNNATGQVNNQTRPYLTLQRAITAVRASLGGSQQGVVYAMPGLYSDAPGANNEAFPIVMADRVHVQGLGAKECVVRLTGANANNVSSWLPPNPGGSDGVIRPIFDMNVLGDSIPTSIEGLTLQGGDVQVWSWAEAPQAARISNCIFDLRQGGEDNLIGPKFGMLLVPTWDVSGGNFYNPLSYHIFNNTFIQGYQRSVAFGDIETARPSNVAICNVNDPRGPLPDPNPSLRGVSDLNIQNNLIRALPGQLATALLGIDSGDTTADIGTNPGRTNAFNPLASGGVDATGTWRSGVIGLPPMPRVSINGGPGTAVDPGFIGEMISQTQFLQLQNRFVRDWRLLPDSALVDAGSGPMATLASSMLSAANGLVYIEHNAQGVRAFDWDGDGHGNPRRRGAEVDIGYDEVDDLAIAGCYGNDSKSHGQSWHPTIRDGNANRTHITTTATLLQYYFTLRFVLPGMGWTFSPGTQVGAPIGAFGTLYLDLSGLTALNLGVTTNTTWTNPVDGTAHTFAQLILPVNDFGAAHFPLHLNGQIIGGTVMGSRLSNLQFEIY